MDIVNINAVTVRTVNPYIQDVKDLVQATVDYTGPEGTAPAGKWIVPNTDVQKTVFYIQQAAIDEGVTARIASRQENGVNSKGSAVRVPVKDVDEKGKETGMTTLLFKITPKRKENGRKPRNTTSKAITE